MPSCFVMQPFDRGMYDKRYADVFEPAIREAGLDPYRVDRDPSLSIPIRDIEDGIRAAELCFAEISTDNPNVWFELGYAIALGKDVVLVCSEPRTSRYPFDVQHRTIISYKTDSSTGWRRTGRAASTTAWPGRSRSSRRSTGRWRAPGRLRTSRSNWRAASASSRPRGPSACSVTRALAAYTRPILPSPTRSSASWRWGSTRTSSRAGGRRRRPDGYLIRP